MKLFKSISKNGLDGKIFNGDAYDFLKKTSSNVADIVFLDPPFNLGKEYSKKNPNMDSKPESMYFFWLKNILEESVRVLKPGGLLYFYHVPFWGLQAGNYLNQYLVFRHWIAVSMKNGFVNGKRLYPAHYGLLLFSKGKIRTFRRPKLRPVRCRHCGEYVKDYGGYKKIIERKGLNLSDVWEDLSPVRHKNYKNRKANELPVKFFKRIFDISAKKGSMYLDPFAGAGSGIIEAYKRKMRFQGCDLVKENCEIIVRRLKSEGKNVKNYS